MKKSLKFPVMVSSIILLAGSSLFQVPTTHAITQQPIAISAEDPLQPQPRIGQVAIFFGGIVVAWIADGVITYKSGRAPSEWIAIGLKSVEQKIKSFDKNNILSRPIQVSSNGEVSGCIAYPCMIRSIDETIDLEELPEPTSPEQSLE
ncbi:hypothetical protein ACIQ57_18640 [Lysinibacillus xylanilyticus]|uniref:hypothetical protein n=1 Tax=Lysinibacillus xylanilyticus TaxID=582475 RepID=UPI0038142C83